MLAVKTILVIEDGLEIRENLIDALEPLYNVVAADNGELGVEMATRMKVDLIICDVMMPKMTGFEVKARLNTDPETKFIPFIFLTAKTEQKDRREGMGTGADDYLVKPFVLRELLTAVATRLEKAQGQDAAIREKYLLQIPDRLSNPLNQIIGGIKLAKDYGDLEALDDALTAAYNLHQQLLDYFEAISKQP